MNLLKKLFNRVSLNTSTDTGVLFEVGNAAIAFAAGPVPGLISLSVAGLCVMARRAGEIRALSCAHYKDKTSASLKSDSKILAPINYIVDKMSGNLGAL